MDEVPEEAVEAILEYRITTPITLAEFREECPADYKHLRDQVIAVLQRAAPAIRKQRDEELRERLQYQLAKELPILPGLRRVIDSIFEKADDA